MIGAAAFVRFNLLEFVCARNILQISLMSIAHLLRRYSTWRQYLCSGSVKPLFLGSILSDNLVEVVDLLWYFT